MAMVGLGHERLGCIEEALELRLQRLAFITDPANAPRPALVAVSTLYARTAIGRLHNRKGDWDAAIRVLLPTVALSDVVGIPRMQAETLAELGQSLCETGQCTEGREYLRAAHALYEQLHNEAENSRVQALLDKHATK